MRYLLDTNVIVPHLAGDPATTALIATLATDGIAVSTVTLMETWQGIYRAADTAIEERNYRAFFATAVMLPFDDTIARRCARLRHDIQQRGGRIRPRALDLMIAATAIEHGLELVTRNINDYRDIPALTLY